MGSAWLSSVMAIAMAVAVGWAQVPRTIELRGHQQTLHVYGSPGGAPIIVSSGDGGWIHLAPYVAHVLAAKGFYVIGFDVRAYLASFTSEDTTLRMENAAADFRALAEFAKAGGPTKPILVGVSEGAGLSLLAAANPETKGHLLGVVGLGLPEKNELGWHWKDSLIYLTHAIPNEPTFSAAAIAASVTPIPLAVIHSTHDEFVSLADVQHVLQQAGEPKRLWIIKASDHRFSDNLSEFEERLLEAVEWVRANAPR